ncbi:hypothetical protein WEB32_12185 [Streptomyces netropsis]|uniref:hypothetical protein n=1 Tax=Streptomyces netropsis TaxID=55404 RepID=UPI0030D3E461
MGNLTEFIAQAASALFGTLVGGAITVHVARWQTARTLTAQAQIAASQQAANATLAIEQRDRQRAAVAAHNLLERLATLYAWLPSLPDVGLETPILSIAARDKCRAAMESIRHGMQTDLFAIADSEVRDRYRSLVALSYDVGYRQVGHTDRPRQIRDVRHYLRYVQLSLEAVIDGGALPAHAVPPVLDRPDGAAWLPPQIPRHWRDPADAS